jgi:tRNA(fMet)-specific endonuclease VapC
MAFAASWSRLYRSRSTTRIADHFGVVRATLEQAGTPIGANDLIIASTALAHDCLVVTRNRREFERVVGLKVEVWP